MEDLDPGRIPSDGLPSLFRFSLSASAWVILHCNAISPPVGRIKFRLARVEDRRSAMKRGGSTGKMGLRSRVGFRWLGRMQALLQLKRDGGGGAHLERAALPLWDRRSLGFFHPRSGLQFTGTWPDRVKLVRRNILKVYLHTTKIDLSPAGPGPQDGAPTGTPPRRDVSTHLRPAGSGARLTPDGAGCRAI